MKKESRSRTFFARFPVQKAYDIWVRPRHVGNFDYSCPPGMRNVMK